MMQILFYKTRLSCDIFWQNTRKTFCVKQNLPNSQKWANPLTAVLTMVFIKGHKGTEFFSKKPITHRVSFLIGEGEEG